MVKKTQSIEGKSPIFLAFSHPDYFLPYIYFFCCNCYSFCKKIMFLTFREIIIIILHGLWEGKKDLCGIILLWPKNIAISCYWVCCASARTHIGQISCQKFDYNLSSWSKVLGWITVYKNKNALSLDFLWSICFLGRLHVLSETQENQRYKLNNQAIAMLCLCTGVGYPVGM